MRKFFVFLLIVLLVTPCIALAHPGRTDGDGGHTDHSTGEYHYHHGYPAHDHYDMDGVGRKDCPYNFDDKTGYNSGSPSSSGNKTSSSTNTNKVVVKPTETKEEPHKTLWEDIIPIVGLVGFYGGLFLFLWLEGKPFKKKKEK